MKRKTFDRLLSAAGAMLALVLIVAGGVLLWGANFANSQVNTQPKDENVFFPKARSSGFEEISEPSKICGPVDDHWPTSEGLRKLLHCSSPQGNKQGSFNVQGFFN